MTTMVYDTPPCCVCGRASSLTVDAAKVARWRSGEHVQDVWPELPADERELLIAGTHPKCWDELFAEDDEDAT